MKAKHIVLLFLSAFSLAPLKADWKNAASDKITVVDKSVFGSKQNSSTKKVDYLRITVSLEAVLKSLPAGSVRIGATLKGEKEITTIFMRSIKKGKSKFEAPLQVFDFSGKTLLLVAWIDPNPDEKISPPNPLVYEKFAFDLSEI